MQVSDQIIKVLDHISNKIGVTIDWSQKNIMPQIQDFMQRYIKYETYSSIMWLIIGIVLLSICVFLIRYSIKQFNNEDYYADEYTLIIALCSFISIVSVIIIFCQIKNLIKINTIPEEYIIRYIKALIPSN